MMRCRSTFASRVEVIASMGIPSSWPLEFQKLMAARTKNSNPPAKNSVDSADRRSIVFMGLIRQTCSLLDFHDTNDGKPAASVLQVEAVPPINPQQLHIHCLLDRFELLFVMLEALDGADLLKRTVRAEEL